MKKKLIVIITCLVIVITFCFFLINKLFNNHDKTYTMYIKINPEVKLIFKEINKCKNNDINNECIATQVIDYELINEDSKIYSNTDIKGKKIEEVINVLASVATDNNINFNDIKITTNWNNMYDKDYLEKKLDKKYNIIINNNNDITNDPYKNEKDDIKIELYVKSTYHNDRDWREVITTDMKILNDYDNIFDGITLDYLIKENMKKYSSCKTEDYYFCKMPNELINRLEEIAKAKGLTIFPDNNYKNLGKDDTGITTIVVKPNNKITSYHYEDKINLNDNIVVLEQTRIGYMWNDTGVANAKYWIEHNYTSDSTFNDMNSTHVCKKLSDCIMKQIDKSYIDELANTNKVWFKPISYIDGSSVSSRLGEEYKDFQFLKFKRLVELNGLINYSDNDIKNYWNNGSDLEIKYHLVSLFITETGGTPTDSYKVLDEKLCEEYNISCGRW